MESFSVTILNEGDRETYEQPQLAGVQIDEDEVKLEFDPIHSDTLSITCGRNDLITVNVEV